MFEPGQDGMFLHDSVFSSSSGHDLPPFSGLWMIFRVSVWTPESPHDTEHGPFCHWLRTQSTANKILIASITYNDI